jgi:hypothetical protein
MVQDTPRFLPAASGYKPREKLASLNSFISETVWNHVNQERLGQVLPWASELL